MMKAKGRKRSQGGRHPASILDKIVFIFFILTWTPLAIASVSGADGEKHAVEQDVKLSIQATNVSLGDLLRCISEKACVPLVLYPRAEELVNLTSQNEDLESVIKGLLREYNYLLHYSDSKAGQLDKISILSRKTPAKEVQQGLPPDLRVTVNQPGLDQHSGQRKITPTPARGNGQNDTALLENLGAAPFDPVKTLAPPVDKTSETNEGGHLVAVNQAMVASFGGVFSTPADQMEATPLALDNSRGFFHQDTAGRQKDGVKLKAISPDSPLASLGLIKGDIVREVNGTPVQSPDDLAKRLGPAIGQGKGPPLIIGLERPVKKDTITDPKRNEQPAGRESPEADNGPTLTPQHIYVQFVQ